MHLISHTRTFTPRLERTFIVRHGSSIRGIEGTSAIYTRTKPRDRAPPRLCIGAAATAAPARAGLPCSWPWLMVVRQDSQLPQESQLHGQLHGILVTAVIAALPP